jgi:hypothetical protein
MTYSSRLSELIDLPDVFEDLASPISDILDGVGLRDYTLTLVPPAPLPPDDEDTSPPLTEEEALAGQEWFEGEDEEAAPEPDSQPASTPAGLFDWGAQTLTLDLAVLSEVEVRLAGLDGVTLVLNPGGFQAVLDFDKDGLSLSFTIGLAVRFSPDLLRPMRAVADPADPGGPVRFEPDDTRPHTQIDVAGVTVTLDTATGLTFEGGIGVVLSEPVMIGQTGVIIESADVELNLTGQGNRPEGTPDTWKGLLLNSASIRVPEMFDGAVTATGLGIGSGGVSGTVGATFHLDYDADEGTFSGDLAGEVFGMAGGVSSFALTLQQNIPAGGGVRAQLTLPFFDATDEPLDLDVGFSAGGGFTVGLHSPDGLLTLEKPDLLRLTLDRIGFDVGGGGATVRISGDITPQIGGLEWPTFAVDELAIDSDGNVRIEGGWLDLPEQHVLDFHGFQLEITKLGFGQTDDGGKWVGFSGGLKLVEGLQAGASVEGLRVTWYPDGSTSVTLEGVGVEFEVPEVLAFKGAVRYRELPGGVHRFDGAIRVDLQALDMTLDGRLVVGMDTVRGEPFLAIYVDVGLPAGIPLWATGLSLYGFAGLVAIGMEPNRAEDEGWFLNDDGTPGWYLRDEVGVTDLANKWDPEPGSFALGAGVTVGTAPDNGFSFNGSLLLVIVFPGPIVLLEGRGDLLKERAGDNEDALFRALAVLDGRAGTFTVGLDGGYRVGKGGELVDISAQVEAFFDFADGDAWYVNLGERTPAHRRVQARVYSLFQASGYVMLDPRRLAMGARFEVDERWEFGPATLALSAYAEGNAKVSFKPSHFYADIAFGGAIEARIFGFGFLIALDAELAADVFTPFHIRGDVRIVLELPWPFSDWERDISFEWGPQPARPPLPLPVKEVAVEHLKSTAVWPLTRGALLVPDLDDGDGFLRDGWDGASPTTPPDAAIPVVPLDGRPRITFGRSVHDDALVSVNPQDALPDAVPAGWEWIGDPTRNEGQVRARYGLKAVTLQQRDGSTWKTVAAAPDGGADTLYGSWAPMPQLGSGDPTPGTDPATANTKLWLWSKTPFDHTRHGGREWDDWFTDRAPGYPCVPAPPSRTIHCDFEYLHPHVVLGTSWRCPEHPKLVVSWAGPADLTASFLFERAPSRTRALCWPAEIPDEWEGWQPNLVQVQLPGSSSHVRLWRRSEQPHATVRGFDRDGQLVFDATTDWTDPWIDVVADGLDRITLQWFRGGFCLQAIEVTLEPDPAHVEARERMAAHLAGETARWSDEGFVLEPDWVYRLRIDTTVETAEWSEAGFNRVRDLTEYAYFRTAGPPGLAELSPPGDGDDPGSETGLDDLGRYVAQTVPPTVAPKGDKPRLPRPVFRAYDVGVVFDEDYVDLLYRLAGRPLRLYLYDTNDRPARDVEGRLLVTGNRWGTTEQRELETSEERWFELVDASDCAVIDEWSVPGHTQVSTAGDDGQVLDADTVYEARLVPLRFGDDFTDGLGAWQVVDESTDDGPSQWATRPAGELDDVPDDLEHGVVEQTSPIGGGSSDAADPHKPGTMLLTVDGSWTDYRFSVLARSSGVGAIGVVVRRTASGYYRFSMDRDGGYRQLVKAAGGAYSVLADQAWTYEPDTDYLVTVEATGPALRVLVDGETVFAVVDDEHAGGQAGLYCWRDGTARFSDVTVDDLSADHPVVARFAFTTSRFANFFHQVHSFDDRGWRTELPGTVDATLVDAARSRAVDPTDPVGDGETRGYAALADLVTGGVPVQLPAAVDATWVAHGDQPVALWLRSPEPIDWARTRMEVARAGLLPPTTVPGPVKLVAVAAGAAAAEDSVTLLLRDTVDLSGWSIELSAVPGALADPAPEPLAVVDPASDGEVAAPDDDVLWEDDFSVPGTDGWTFVDEPPYTIRASEWVVEDGELRELTNLYGFTDAPYGKPGTYGVVGDAVWTDYRLAVRLRSDQPAAIGALFRYRDDDHYYRFSANAGRGYRRLTKKTGGRTQLLWEDSGPTSVGAWHDLEIRCVSNRIVGTLDGVTLFDVFDDDADAIAAGRVGVYCRANTGTRFDRVTVTDLRATAVRPKVATAAVGADVLCRTPLPAPSAEPLKVLVRHRGPGDFYRLSVIPRTGAAALVRRAGGVPTTLWKGDLSWASEAAELVVAAQGERIHGFVDGVPVFIVDDAVLPTGAAGMAGVSGAVEVFGDEAAFDDWLLFENFDEGALDRWEIVDEGARDRPSAWALDGGWLRQTSNIHGHAGGADHRPGTYALAGDRTWTDYRLSVRLRSHDDDAIGVMVRYRDADNYYRFSMDAERRYRQLVRKVDGVVTVLWRDDEPYNENRDYLVAVECIGSTISGYVDGKPLFSVTDEEVPAGCIGLYCWANDDSWFSRVRVAAPTWRPSHRFEQERPLASGTRVRVHGGTEDDAPPDEPGVVRRFAGVGSMRIPSDATVRLTTPSGEVGHQRRFVDEAAFSPVDAQVLRSADGTGLFVLLDEEPPACRLSLEYRRDNTAADPDSLTLSQGGDTGPEHVSIVVPGR